MKKLLLALVLLLSSLPASANTWYASDGIAGYTWTSAASLSNDTCGSNCQYITATFTIPIPTNVQGGGTADSTEWIAIAGNNLAQFGFIQQVSASQVQTLVGFYELYPVNGLSQVTQGQFAHTGGDRVRLTMHCTSTCVDNSNSTTFNLLWENLTQGNSYSTNVTWNVVFSKFEVVTEALNPPSSSVNDNGIVTFTDIKAGTSLGTAVPVIFDHPDTNVSSNRAGQLHVNVLPTSGTTRQHYPSPPFGNSFSVCYVTPKWPALNTLGPCASRPYSGQVVGFGP